MYHTIPRYIYNPSRIPPATVSLELMDQVRRLYSCPIRPQIREVRPVDVVTAAGLDEVRSFRGRRV